MTKKNLGTKEEGWAGVNGVSFGIENGCRNGCLYCWSRLDKDKPKFPDKPLITWEDWEHPTPRKSKQTIKHIKDGRYMFPSTHDIHPENMKEVLKVCLEILQKGNYLLITTKPHYEVIQYLTAELVEFRNQVEFRFSIGSIDNRVLKDWEVNASTFEERKRCLKLAFMMGYDTSVVIEPYLDEHPDFVVKECHAFVSRDFWVGRMNHFSELIKKVSDIRQLGYLYTQNRMLEIKRKLDAIDYASIRYKNKEEWMDLE